ncbi:hypothetical protein ACR9E3_30745 [Actinomycetospora sp. C-140]
MITNRDLDVIGLRGLTPPAAAAPSPRSAPDEADTYELVRDVPTLHGGWSLRCRHAGRVAWSMPLASRGAAPGVRPGVAQAVAVRVLSELGVFVSGWNQLDDGDDGSLDDAWRFVARRPRGADAVPV